MIVSTCSTALNADNLVISEKCQEVYKTCFKHQLDENWSMWEWWYEGQTISHEDWVTKQLDNHFQMAACDEVAAECESNRPPDIQRYLDQYNELSEVEWEQTTSKEAGLNSTAIQKAISEASSISNLRSLLVATNGKLVVEEYYNRKNDPRPQHVQSVTKSITSLLVGIAIDKGFIASEKEVIKPYFPEYFSKPHDERKEKITINQLLTMSSRLNFVDHAVYTKLENINNWDQPGKWKAYWYSDNYLDRALENDLVESDDDQLVLYSTPACNL